MVRIGNCLEILRGGRSGNPDAGSYCKVIDKKAEHIHIAASMDAYIIYTRLRHSDFSRKCHHFIYRIGKFHRSQQTSFHGVRSRFGPKISLYAFNIAIVKSRSVERERIDFSCLKSYTWRNQPCVHILIRGPSHIDAFTGAVPGPVDFSGRILKIQARKSVQLTLRIEIVEIRGSDHGSDNKMIRLSGVGNRAGIRGRYRVIIVHKSFRRFSQRFGELAPRVA